jgi:hypothetical protein
MNRLTPRAARPFTPITQVGPTTPAAPDDADRRTDALNRLGLRKDLGNQALAHAAHAFMAHAALDRETRCLLSEHGGDDIAALALLQGVRPDFVPVLRLMAPEHAPFDERVQRSVRCLRGAVEHGLAVEIQIDGADFCGAVMDALEDALEGSLEGNPEGARCAPGARITAFHFEQEWAEHASGRFVNRMLLERLREGLRRCPALQSVSGSAGVLWLLDRPVPVLALAFRQPPDEETVDQLERVLANGVGRLACAADHADVFAPVARRIQVSNRHADPSTALRSVTVVYPHGDLPAEPGMDLADRLLRTPHLRQIDLPVSAVPPMSDDALIGLIRRQGLQSLRFGGASFTLSPAVQAALAHNRSLAQQPPH